MTVTNKFGAAVRRIRRELGWSQEELAKRLNTTKQVVSNYETCKRSPNIYVASDYAKALGVTLQDLLGVTDVSEDEDRLEALHQNPKLGLLFDRSRKMSESDIEFMLQMADRIVKENYDE